MSTNSDPTGATERASSRPLPIAFVIVAVSVAGLLGVWTVERPREDRSAREVTVLPAVRVQKVAPSRQNPVEATATTGRVRPAPAPELASSADPLGDAVGPAVTRQPSTPANDTQIPEGAPALEPAEPAAPPQPPAESAAPDRLAERDSARSSRGGGGALPLGSDAWSPLLDGAIGARRSGARELGFEELVRRVLRIRGPEEVALA